MHEKEKRTKRARPHLQAHKMFFFLLKKSFSYGIIRKTKGYKR